jgi:hypothetical protein
MAVGPQGPMDKAMGFRTSVLFFRDVKTKMAEWEDRQTPGRRTRPGVWSIV